jgi:hypothetical protein
LRDKPPVTVAALASLMIDRTVAMQRPQFRPQPRHLYYNLIDHACPARGFVCFAGAGHVLRLIIIRNREVLLEGSNFGFATI